MPLALRLRDVAAEQVAFSCSPANEVLRSLHVLHDVKHHPLHISWMLATRARMSTELKSEIAKFAFWSMDRCLVFPEIWPPTEIACWEANCSRCGTLR